METFGRIDAWVNAAAVWSYGRFEDTPSQVFRQVVDTTLFGPGPRRPGGAAAVQVARARSARQHLLAVRAALLPYVAPYVTAKWGLLGFSEVLRQEVRDAPGVAVCTILPGAVDTPIYRRAANYVGRQVRPLPPVTSPDRVVAAVVRAVDHPQREIVVGRAHHLGAWAHRLVPRLYDRLVGPIVNEGALRNIPVPAHNGTVFTPDPASNAVDDGWRQHDHRFISKILALGTDGVGAAAVAVTVRRRLP